MKSQIEKIYSALCREETENDDQRIIYRKLSEGNPELEKYEQYFEGHMHGIGIARKRIAEIIAAQAQRTEEIQKKLRRLREQEESMETGSERNIEYEDLLIEIAGLTGELRAYGQTEDRSPEELEIIY